MRKRICSVIREHTTGPLSYCEVGVAKGDTAAHILDELDVYLMVLVDKWAPYDEERTPLAEGWDQQRLLTKEDHAEIMHGVLQRFCEERKVVVVRSDSVLLGELLQPYIFNAAFLDADHRYETTKSDIETYWETVKPGGVLIGHDYNSNAEKRANYWGVKRAVDEFCEKHGLKLNLENQRLWWIKK